jgi:hypothetical protein
MPTTHDLLKKINYIEADIEIQKQILFSLPRTQHAEIEKTVKLIADQKAEIESLRQQIKAINPEEYEQILVFEKAVTKFKKLAATLHFQTIINKNPQEPCVLSLKSGESIECLIKACDALGDWTIINMQGEIHQFQAQSVVS